MPKHVFEVVSKQVKVGGAIAPADQAAGSYQTAGFSRVGFSEVVLVLATGAVSGAPTSTSIKAKLQHKSATETTFVDFSDEVDVANGANQSKVVGFDCSMAKEDVRVVITVSFTGGTSPKVMTSAVALLAGTSKIPV